MNFNQLVLGKRTNVWQKSFNCKSSACKHILHEVLCSLVFEEALTATSLLRPYLGRALLDWYPRKHGFLADLELYYNAWKANAGLE